MAAFLLYPVNVNGDFHTMLANFIGRHKNQSLYRHTLNLEVCVPIKCAFLQVLQHGYFICGVLNHEAERTTRRILILLILIMISIMQFY